MKTPAVYLVGTGPGDPGLITVHGLECLRRADVVIHDHEVPTRILKQASPGAELIDVGSSGRQPMEQDAITFLLADKAREGKLVARLKRGDPFVFDRGGEEALFLHAQGIPFEVVPGIPLGIGVPAYAGVPVTYPGGGDTITLVRGYEDDNRVLPDVDWASLALDLGFADQAHFIRDFKKLVGCAPAAYARRLERPTGEDPRRSRPPLRGRAR